MVLTVIQPHLNLAQQQLFILMKIGALLILLCISPTVLGNIRALSAKIELSSNTNTKVTLKYQLDSLPATVGFRAIRFDDVVISNLSFSSENRTIEHVFDQSDFPLLTGRLRIISPKNIALITITYVVQSIDSANKSIPVVLLDLTPPQARNKVFTAEILYPSGYELQQSFPSIPWTESELRSEFDMQVIPSLVKAKIIPLGSAGISPTTLIDVFVMISLLGLSYIGWRRLKTQNS